MRRIKGFTLTELVVVVIILSVIAMFAIPNYYRGLQKQQERKGDTIVRQLALGAQAWQSATSAGTVSTSNVNTINSTLRTDIMLDPGEGVSVTINQSNYLVSFTYSGRAIGLGWTGGTMWTEPCCATSNCVLLPDCT